MQHIWAVDQHVRDSTVQAKRLAKSKFVQMKSIEFASLLNQKHIMSNICQNSYVTVTLKPISDSCIWMWKCNAVVIMSLMKKPFKKLTRIFTVLMSIISSNSKPQDELNALVCPWSCSLLLCQQFLVRPFWPRPLSPAEASTTPTLCDSSILRWRS